MKFPPMSSYETRRSTFFANEDTTVKGRKKLQPLWPHPVSASTSASVSSTKAKTFPSPSEMAALGLYFDTSTNQKVDATHDACVLYPEGHTLDNWKAGDIVRERILSIDPTASLALIHDSNAAGVEDENEKRWLWTSETLLPNSKTMNEARLRTFATAWPYDGKKGWKPTSKKVAQAGFHFTPNDTENDCATCVYCDCALGGWEKGDDPVQEHQRRRPECKFFNCALSNPSPQEELPASKTTGSRSASIATTKRARAASKRKNNNDDGSEPEDAHVGAATTMMKDEKTEVEAAAQPKGRGASRAKKQTKLTDDESSGQQLHKSSTTSRKASQRNPKSGDVTIASKTVIDHAEEDEEMDEPEDNTRATEQPRARRGSRSVEVVIERRKSGARSKDDIAPAPASNGLGSDDATLEEEPAPLETNRGATLPSAEPHTISARDESPSPLPAKVETIRPATSETPEISAPEATVVKRPSKLDPYVVAPLTTLAKLDATEQNMSVESWLKLQVAKACHVMEREGKQRIDRLEEEIRKGRVEIEAALRGRPLSAQTAM